MHNFLPRQFSFPLHTIHHRDLGPTGEEIDDIIVIDVERLRKCLLGMRAMPGAEIIAAGHSWADGIDAAVLRKRRIVWDAGMVCRL